MEENNYYRHHLTLIDGKLTLPHQQTVASNPQLGPKQKYKIDTTRTIPMYMLLQLMHSFKVKEIVINTSGVVSVVTPLIASSIV